MNTSRLISFLAFTAGLTLASAQPPRGNRKPPQEPPVPPIFAEIDTNRDRVLSAEELQAAFEILDKNDDGEITLEELRMPPPDGGKPPKKPKGQMEPQSPPPGRPPAPPVIAVLDADHDGIISAGELANAPESLKDLDKNSDGQLTPDEFGPPGPPPPGDARNEGVE